MILDYQFFFGFILTSSYGKLLNQVSQPVRSLFIQNNSECLQQIEYKGQVYLGKTLDSLIEMQSLELLEANIYSLLQRLVPHYPYKESSLILLPLPMEIKKE